MFKHGDIVRDELRDRIGVVAETSGAYHHVMWFIGGSGTTYHLSDELIAVEKTPEHEFRAALALGDTATALEMYRDLQAALENFAAYGKLKLRYPANAVFTMAYDREGRDVILLFEDFNRAAELLPNAVGRTSKTTAMGGAGGIAEIANNATQEREYRVQYEMNGEASVGRVLADSPEHAARLVRESVPGATNVNVLVLNPTGVRP